MSFFQEDGVLTSRTSPGPDVVTLTGSGAALDVKLVKLVMNGATATGGANTDYFIGIGFSDGTTERAVAGVSEDNVATTVTRRAAHNNAVVVVYDTAGTLIDLGTISAIGAGTFTINWTTKSANAYKIGWTAWGGSDITGVELGSFTSRVGAGTQNISTTLKSADVGFFFGKSSAAENSASTNHILGFGMADNNLNQGLVSVASSHNAGTSITDRYQVTDACVGAIFSSAVREEGALTAFDATNGIQLNWTTAVGTLHYYVIIKGGRWEVGSGTYRDTTTGTKAYTTSFEPVGVSTVSFGLATNSAVQASNIVNFGSSDGTTEWAFLQGDRDNQPTTICGTRFWDDQTATASGNPHVSAGYTVGITHEGSIVTGGSFNATDFTLNFTTVNATAVEFIWLVCAGNASGGGEPVVIPIHIPPSIGLTRLGPG